VGRDILNKRAPLRYTIVLIWTILLSSPANYTPFSCDPNSPKSYFNTPSSGNRPSSLDSPHTQEFAACGASHTLSLLVGRSKEGESVLEMNNLHQPERRTLSGGRLSSLMSYPRSLSGAGSYEDECRCRHQRVSASMLRCEFCGMLLSCAICLVNRGPDCHSSV